MQIKDIEEVKVLLEKNPTPSLFFHRDIENVTNTQILSALMRIPNVDRDEAIAVSKAINPSEKRILVGDFLEFLSMFSIMKRKAILLALEQNLTLEQVVLLKWKDALRIKKLTQTSREILLSLPRHLFCEFAFWEYGSKAEARPLMTLIADFSKTSKEDLNYLRQMYGSMIMVNTGTDIVELNKILKTL